MVFNKMSYTYEKIWYDIDDINISNIQTNIRSFIRYRKDSGISFFIAELEFITDDNPGNTINIDLPQITDSFSTCENTILASKKIDGEEIDSIIRLILRPGHLQLISYPFAPNTEYEIKLQLFMCQTDEKFFRQCNN
jgi:hypothetical protein